MTDTHNIHSASNPVGESTTDTIIAIKADLRAAMNGVAAQSIRQSGAAYRLVYGVDLPRLRSIAADYSRDRRLALALWNDNIRETRMLAVMLMPPEEFDSNLADLWVDGLRREESDLAGLLVMDLIAHAPYAIDKAYAWMADERETYQLCGFLTITRLLMQGVQLSESAEAELLDQAAATLPSAFLPLRRAATNALLRLSESAPHLVADIDKLLSGQ